MSNDNNEKRTCQNCRFYHADDSGEYCDKNTLHEGSCYHWTLFTDEWQPKAEPPAPMSNQNPNVVQLAAEGVQLPTDGKAGGPGMTCTFTIPLEGGPDTYHALGAIFEKSAGEWTLHTQREDDLTESVIEANGLIGRLNTLIEDKDKELARLRLLMMNAQMCPRCGGKGDFHGEKFICDNCVEVK